MKTIQELLKEYGLTVPEDKAESFEKAFAESYQSADEYGKQAQALAAMEDKMKMTEAALKKFDGVDVETLKSEAQRLKLDLEAKEADYQNKIADMEFRGLLDAAIASAKGRNAKSICANLDVESLKASRNQSEDIKTALSALKETDGYLFEDTQAPPAYAAGTGSAPVFGDANLADMRAAMGLPAQK